MSMERNFDQLKNYVAGQAQTRQTYHYLNATSYSKELYERALQMGTEILKEHQQGYDEPQAMIDLVAQAIYNSQKALNGPITNKHSLNQQLHRAGFLLRSQEFTGFPIKLQQDWKAAVKKAHQVSINESTDQVLADQTAAKLANMFEQLEHRKAQLTNKIACQRTRHTKRIKKKRRQYKQAKKKNRTK